MTGPKYCVSCGEEIPKKRLEAVPGTTTCVKCAMVPKRKRSDLRGDHFIQHTGGLHEKYLHEEDAEMDRKHEPEDDRES
jgi:hypothetical protein